MNNKIKLKSINTLKQKYLREDPVFRKAYNDLDFEFKLLEAIIKARARKSLTQKQLAAKIGIAQSALARFEGGNTNPTLSFLKKVTHGLGLRLTVK